MAGFFPWLAAGGVLILPAVSAFLGLCSSRADLSFLIMLVFALCTGALWFSLKQWFNRSTDDFIQYFMIWSLFVSLVLSVVLTPIVVLISGWEWYWVTLFGAGLILSAEVMAAIQLRYS